MEDDNVELAKVTSKGQITIPVAIRRALGLKDGDKVMFIEQEGMVIMMNASLDALLEAQQAFSGAAEEMGLRDEQDVVNMVREIRAERSSNYTCE